MCGSLFLIFQKIGSFFIVAVFTLASSPSPSMPIGIDGEGEGADLVQYTAFLSSSGDFTQISAVGLCHVYKQKGERLFFG